MYSSSQNKVQLIGVLGQEIDLRHLAEDKFMAHFSMATHEQRKTKDGQKETITTWHNLEAWGKTAQIMAKIFAKGQRLYVEGKITYRTYETKSGEKRYSTYIQVSDFKKLEKDDTSPPVKA